MKKAVLILFVFLSLAAMGQNRSNLTISTTGNSNLKIRLGNNRYSFQDRTATFQGLQPGNYDLAIFQWQKKPDGRFDYVQVYNSSITLTANRHTEISILRFGKMAWDEGPIVADGWSDSYTNPDPTNPSNNSNGYNQQAIDNVQFASIKKSISSEFGEENMLRVAKVALKNNWFTSKQIKEIANVFFSDDTKLSFGKYAYDFVVDKGNYIVVGDVFYSPQKRIALLDYIGNR
jgi:hypothetical protein